ncbi:hypothetical protein [Haloglycomyces albus]|uniref:hypothetical protein n=1 Tax=Haloglycomyces albus TaxID=526067 RepID=UPI00046D88CE|nr:hypothetical protein [Haloglycomyces albus]
MSETPQTPHTEFSWNPGPDAPKVPGARPPHGSQDEAVAAITSIWDKPRKDDDRTRSRSILGVPERRQHRRPTWTLPGIVVLACVMAFFAWVAAPATMLALGWGETQQVEVTTCAGGFAPQCSGMVVDSDASVQPWEETSVDLIGDVSAADVGQTREAEVVNDTVYIGDDLGLWLRALIPLGFYVITTMVFVYVSGAGRLYSGKRAARLACVTFAGALWLGFVGVGAVSLFI